MSRTIYIPLWWAVTMSPVLLSVIGTLILPPTYPGGLLGYRLAHGVSLIGLSFLTL